ncbi:MAG TPA: hypothetical protein VHD59_03495 [Pseudolabrys sp.]|nr:hypothetical protein [Pseudolabrys sp.]
MKSEKDIENLERVMGQLDALHIEISQLAKKSPNDGVNKFKLKLINKLIGTANEVLGDDYRPFSEFNLFDEDDLPTNSDVTLIVGQYLEQCERFRSDNIEYFNYKWYYVLGGKRSKVLATAPTKIGGKK